MAEVITIEPVTRIEGQARIAIHLDQQGEVERAQVEIAALRGFEHFIKGRPAEEIPRIVTRICGICPWMHHLASVKAVDACFGLRPAVAGHRLRELCLILAHIHDKILHFFFLAAPDFVLGPEEDYTVRNIMGLVQQEPELAARVVRMRRLVQQMLERCAGKAIHPVAAVVGGFAKPITETDRAELLVGARALLDFALEALDYAKAKVFNRFEGALQELGALTTGFLGTVDADGQLRLYDGKLRLMQPDGIRADFSVQDYAQHLAEHVEPYSTAKLMYAQSWGQGVCLDPDAPAGIYRANTLARLNVCDRIATPRAQEELTAFRAQFGRPAQGTLLYHYARLIELLYTCERSLELLGDDRLTAPAVRKAVTPKAGQGIGHVEAPRGTLIHDYQTDADGCITRANIIVGTSHNIGPMNLSVQRAARDLIHHGRYDQELLNRIEMAVRAYDP